MIIKILELKKNGGFRMSRKTNGYYGKTRTSKLIWISLGGLVVILLVLPYFVNNIQAIFSLGLYSLKGFGLFIQSLGYQLFILGLIFFLVFFFFKKPGSRTFLKIFIIGLALIFVGMLLSDPYGLLNIFNGGPSHKGYHFLVYNRKYWIPV